MGHEIVEILSGWETLDTWIVVTAALAAMACALPGNFLILRRQSMMGDALSHTVLPGIVIAFLIVAFCERQGWISGGMHSGWRHAAMFGGAMGLGVVSALLTEAVQKLGRVESSAALGVVFTSLFAVGLLLIRVAADKVHLDPDCVLYGMIETVVMDTYPGSTVPRAAVVNGLTLLANLGLIALFFKELRLAAFDPGLADALGFRSRTMHYALMAVTAATLVAAFESVGSILVIAMLIVPAAAAYLLTDRLSTMIGLSLVIAAFSALVGHAAAITLPSIVFSRLGFPMVADASTAGTMAVAAGALFVLAMLLGPRHGLVSKFVDRARLGLRIVREDVLGLLFRMEELRGDGNAAAMAPGLLRTVLRLGPLESRLALWRLRREGNVTVQTAGIRLSQAGRNIARSLVRSHRLWESYLARHFLLPADHLHGSAERVEHFIDPTIEKDLADELKAPSQDPHGRTIP